jgi:hypothetical protein
MNPVDQKWLDALTAKYPVEGITLPFWRNTDGSVNAVVTITHYLTLIGVKLQPGGRIADPGEHGE